MSSKIVARLKNPADLVKEPLKPHDLKINKKTKIFFIYRKTKNVIIITLLMPYIIPCILFDGIYEIYYGTIHSGGGINYYIYVFNIAKNQAISENKNIFIVDLSKFECSDINIFIKLINENGYIIKDSTNNKFTIEFPV